MNLVGLVVVAAFLVGCGELPSNSPGEHSSKAASTVAVADNVLIVPGQRVGEFVIGQNNATSIWEYKKRQARSKLNAYTLGLDTQFAPELQFQLGSGGELYGVLVQSAEYATAEGLRVGMSATDIEAALGEPRLRGTERHGGVDVPVLDYGGIVFRIDNDRVTGIWVRA